MSQASKFDEKSPKLKLIYELVMRTVYDVWKLDGADMVAEVQSQHLIVRG